LILRRTVLLALAALPATISARDLEQLKVDVEYEKAVDFSKFKTYAWVPFQEPAKDPTNHLRITDAVERELELKGFAKSAEPLRADMFVEYTGRIEKKVRSTPSKQDSTWQPSSPRFVVNFDKVRVGTLVIRLWDGASKDVVWRASGSETVQEGPQPASVVDEAVRCLLASFPPKPDAPLPQ